MRPGLERPDAPQGHLPQGVEGRFIAVEIQWPHTFSFAVRTGGRLRIQHHRRISGESTGRAPA
jgi:hypothetical protein